MAEGSCDWTEGRAGAWRTECGQRRAIWHPRLKEWKHCPWCGKAINYNPYALRRSRREDVET